MASSVTQLWIDNGASYQLLIPFEWGYHYYRKACSRQLYCYTVHCLVLYCPALELVCLGLQHIFCAHLL
jgi:hypothetical protein